MAHLGIDRLHYIAMRTPDPEAAAHFAEEHMGLTLVQRDGAGRHYLAAHGLDRYSLVYTPGESGIDHVSYLVREQAALDRAQESLAASGVAAERVDESDLWHHAPAVRFQTPSDATIELTTGVNVDLPMAWNVRRPPVDPAPISLDHVILRATDVEASVAFASDVMGLKVSGRIVAPDGVPFITFFRSHTLYHCYGVAHSEYDGLNHLQFTLKNDPAVIAAHARVKETAGDQLIWGPLRHGCGQNVVFYFFDAAGNVIEYSAEEEVILNEDTYEVISWPIDENPRGVNEWSLEGPPASMR
ncbi:Metapyrocatechase [Baekduia alba]|uniref:VOC family protein n=1 Tax=Baekduia alba TaxID=2997333 RepID=UPI002340D287|nr:VOC family protein [Baekduia alba]WCB91764.1 Metapyrocatechase [Baekduia alba]